MNTKLLVRLALAALAAPGSQAFAVQAAQVIFSSDALTVIDALGTERRIKQGDFIQPGERVVVPPGVMGQIRLPDGTLLGARPGTDLKFESIVNNLKNVLVLNEGNVRIINVEPPKGPAPLPVDVVSPVSTLQLKAGDGEAIHVKAGSKSIADPGTYNRLQSGSATVINQKGSLPLVPLQSGFVSRSDIVPVKLDALPSSLTTLRTALTTTPLVVSGTTRLADSTTLKTSTLSTFTSSFNLALADSTTLRTGTLDGSLTKEPLLSSTTLAGTTLTSSTGIKSATLDSSLSKDLALATTFASTTLSPSVTSSTASLTSLSPSMTTLQKTLTASTSTVIVQPTTVTSVQTSSLTTALSGAVSSFTSSPSTTTSTSTSGTTFTRTGSTITRIGSLYTFR